MIGSDSFDNPIFNICVKLFRSEDRQAYFAYNNQTGFVNFKKKKKKKFPMEIARDSIAISYNKVCYQTLSSKSLLEC